MKKKDQQMPVKHISEKIGWRAGSVEMNCTKCGRLALTNFHSRESLEETLNNFRKQHRACQPAPAYKSIV